MEFKKVNYKYCMAPMCTNTTVTTPKKIFFMVPNIGEIRKKWCLAMKRDPAKNSALISSSSLYCCEDHFNLEKDTENFNQFQISSQRKGKHVGLRLKKGALPHIFQGQPESDVLEVSENSSKKIKLDGTGNSPENYVSQELETCRTCFESNGPYDSMVSFQEKIKDHLNLTVAELLVKLNCLRIPDSKNASKKICALCYKRLRAAYDFQLQCHQTEELWKKALNENDSPISIDLDSNSSLPCNEIIIEYIIENESDNSNATSERFDIKPEIILSSEKSYLPKKPLVPEKSYESEKDFYSHIKCKLEFEEFQLKKEIDDFDKQSATNEDYELQKTGKQNNQLNPKILEMKK